MTVREAASKLELSPHTVYELCAAGKLRHRRLGPRRGKIQITDEALTEYLRECEVAPGSRKEPAPKKARPRPLMVRPDGKPLRRKWD